MAEATHLAFGGGQISSFSGSPVTSTTSITLTNGTNVGVKFCLSAGKTGGGAPSITAVTYNGVSLTQIGTEIAFGTSSDERQSEWWLASPATGSAHNLVVTYSGTPTRTTYFWEEVEGAHQSTLPTREVTYQGTTTNGVDIAISVPNTAGAAFLSLTVHDLGSTIWNTNTESDTTTARAGVTVLFPRGRSWTVASASTPYTANLRATTISATTYSISAVRIPGIAAAAAPRVLMIG